MGNKSTKSRKKTVSGKDNSLKNSDSEQVYYQLLASSTISGASWKELHEKLVAHMNDTAQLEKEWQALGEKQAAQKETGSFTEAKKIVNMDKNRYPNILAYDNTRVKLAQQGDVVGSDYINANYVDIGSHKYICTQAPLHNTVSDFHRLIWETGTKTVVMLTKNIEGGKVKAFEYLPKSEPTNDEDIVDEDDKQKTFGDLTVRADETTYSSDKSYSVTTFTEGKGGDLRKCKRYQFLDWPDHKVPETAKLLNMIDKVNEEIVQNPDIPVIIHCSAGIGRTGTWILLTEVMYKLEQALKDPNATPPTINIMQTIHHLRGMREGLINHPDQYKYCYQTIADHIQRIMARK